MAAQSHEITYRYEFVRLCCHYRCDYRPYYALDEFKIETRVIKQIDDTDDSKAAPVFFVYVLKKDGVLFYKYDQILSFLPSMVQSRRSFIISTYKTRYDRNIETVDYISYINLVQMLEIAYEIPNYEKIIDTFMQSSYFIDMEQNVRNNEKKAYVSELRSSIFLNLKIDYDNRYKQIISALPVFMDEYMKDNDSCIIDPNEFPQFKKIIDDLNIVFYGRKSTFQQ